MPKYPSKQPNVFEYKKPNIAEQLQKAGSQGSIDPDALSKETAKLNYAKVEPIVERLDNIDKRFDSIDKKLNEIRDLIIGLPR